MAGNAAGGHIIFDGTNTSISSSAFYLGSPTQYISGSLGNIEISSSNFHLDNAGNVVMSGNVSATTGTIGGLTIGSTKLSSNVPESILIPFHFKNILNSLSNVGPNNACIR